MTWGHARVASGITATFVGLAILSGILFGARTSLRDILNFNSSLRELCIALWAFLFPAWSQLGEAWFAPRRNADELARFYEAQQRARLTWMIVAGVVAIAIGTSAPELPTTVAHAGQE